MGAERSQWQFPANEVGKVIGWSDEASPSNPSASKGLVNKGPFATPADLEGKQDAADNLTTLSSSTLGTTGLDLLATDTVEEAATALNVKALNDDDGFTFSGAVGPINADTTITGTATTGLYEFNHGHFGGLFASARARSVFENVTDTGLGAETGPRFAVAITHESEGNTNSLAGNTHCGLWVFGGKADWLNSTNKGDHSATYFMTQNGRKGNGAAINMATYKVFTGDTGVDDGGAMCFEGSGIKVDTSGATTAQCQVYGGYVYDGGSASSTHVHHQKLLGFYAEYQSGTSGYAAFSAASRVNSSGAPKWENVLSAITDRNGSEYFRITGDGHSQGAGLVQAGDGSVTRPAFAFRSGTATGMFLESANVIGFATNGVQRALINSSGVLVNASVLAHYGTAIPAGGTAGAGIRLSSTVNFGIFFGSGVPTLSAAQGSLYLRSDGSSTSTRMYVNTNGTTGWAAVTTAS